MSFLLSSRTSCRQFMVDGLVCPKGKNMLTIHLRFS